MEMPNPRKKRIAILSDYPYWNYFDNVKPECHPAAWLAALQQAFAREKSSPYELHWITLTKNVKKMQTCCVDGQYMYLLPAGSRTLAQYMRYLPDRWQIARCLRQIKPDLVHAWGTESCYGLSAVDYKGKKLLSLQGALTAYVQRAPMHPFMVRQARMERYIFKRFPVITTESVWARERVLELVPEADVRLWEYAAEERFFATERCPSVRPTCVMAGTNTPIKNVPLAIAAFSRPELRHITLYLAGVACGAYSDLPENIIPLGLIGRERMLELLRETWALVHPSLADCCPNVVKETRVLGVPCVVTTECGAKQYVVDGKSGFVISPGNEKELVEAVLRMTKDAETSLAMGRYDVERCREELSAGVMYRKICALYEEILAK